MDDEAAKASPIFGGRVAHGYLILSFAAGLFVDPAPGPVLANTGLDSLRFLTPLYPGDSMRVELTVKSKSIRDAEKGEVRWAVEVFNQKDEIVATYELLTMNTAMIRAPFAFLLSPSPPAAARHDRATPPQPQAAGRAPADRAADLRRAHRPHLSARHDSAFTEGLFYLDGQLYESTGLVGRSTIRRVRLEDGHVLQSVAIPAGPFGEGHRQLGRPD